MPLIDKPSVCEKECESKDVTLADTRFIVITGGPGAGKTAVLEIIRKALCRHVVILPEAASIVFGGGFWRLPSHTAKMAAQRSILHIQQELERMAQEETQWPVALCDRGVLDGLAYWADDESSFWQTGKTNLQAEYQRYHMVIHLRTPSEMLGYNHQNPLRTESALQAKIIDDKIAAVWSGHPRYRVIESFPDFLVKASAALSFVLEELPGTCVHALYHPGLKGIHEKPI